MKRKHIKLYCICLLLLTIVGCNGYEGQNVGDTDSYRGFWNNDEQTFDDYRLNEEEQLMGRGHMEAQMDPNGAISNANTDIPSNQYPHTKAIQIQAAKYKFVVDGGTKFDAKQQFGGAIPTPQPKGAPDQKAQPQAPVKQPQVEQPEVAPAPQPEAAPTPQPKQTGTKEQQQTPAKTPATEGISGAAAKVIELTNAERRKNGLPEFQADTQLSNVAKVKSDDMQQNNYFSHTSPTHGSPFDMIRDHGVSYSSAGENIAQGQQTPEQVVQSWMNSEGHRKNILSSDFTHIGVGYAEQGHYWTQMFIRK